MHTVRSVCTTYSTGVLWFSLWWDDIGDLSEVDGMHRYCLRYVTVAGTRGGWVRYEGQG